MLKQYLELPRAVHILCIGAFVNRAGTFLVPFLTIYLQKELNLGTGFATRAMGAYGVGAFLASLVGGHLADRIGRRVVMLISLFGSAAVLLVFGSLSSPWIIMVALLIFSLIAEMYRPAALAMIADLTESNRRPHAYGLMYVAVNLGFSVAAAVGGSLSQFSFQWLFWGDALTACVYGGLILVTIRETLPSRVGGLTVQPVDPPDDGDERGAPPIKLNAALKHILTDWTFMVYSLGIFFLAVTYIQAMSTFPLYLGQLGIGAAGYGVIIALNGLMIVVLQLPITSIVVRFNRGAMVILSAVLTAVGFGFIGLADTMGQFALTVVVWTTGELISAPLMTAIVSDLAPTPLRARYMGVCSMCFSSAMMVGAPLGGAVLAQLGGQYLWAGSAAVGMTAALAFWFVRNRITVPQAAVTARH